jgi:sugar lactone lactonase YvrE
VALSVATIGGILALLALPKGVAETPRPAVEETPQPDVNPPVVPPSPGGLVLPPPIQPVEPIGVADPLAGGGRPGDGDGEPPRAAPARRPWEVRLWYKGFKNARAVAVDAAGRAYVSDSGVIHLIRGDGRREAWLKDPDATAALALDATGGLLAGRARTAQVVRIDPATRRDTPLRGRFPQPRHLIADRHGGFYVCDAAGLHHVAKSGQAVRQESAPARPRAVALAPDGRTLYVLAGGPEITACPLDPAGAVGRGRQLCRVEGAAAGGLVDLAVDPAGRLLVLNDTARAVERIGRDGVRLGTTPLPDGPVACTVGGPGRRTLYVLTRTSVYTIDLD